MDARISKMMEKIRKGEEFCVYESIEAYQYMREIAGKCFVYNSLNPETQAEEQLQLLKKLFKKTGDFLMIMPPFHCTIGAGIEVGENFICNAGVTMQDLGGIKIGDNAMIAPGVSINSTGHVSDWKKRIQGWSYAHPITIGNNVFIGANATICCSQSRGLRIGDNVVIGAGSVVTKDIPDNVLVAGNPCRIIRKLEK
ncbi:sugar O-acetyltransferase [Dorea formicigenerans]|uniref:Acetyltransferase n=1 Tax=Dorea formicigenerans TaxID=39486 RepID=A0A564TW75_9FIRM|nr:sugar O-acetyltransferase [Dorea formicigenerans]VUX11479.1 Galactoside O-acetyltransferase [Dorea formicigenerans]